MSAEAEIKQFIDRILRLKEEQDTLGEDIREVYAEAKGRGFDKTALGNVVGHLRKVQKVGRDTMHEREAIFDLYLTAYETGGRAHAPACARENTEEFPVSAKLVETVATGLQTETGRMALIAAEIHERPSNDDESSPEAGPQAESSQAGTGTGKLADREGRSEGEAVSTDLPANYAPPAFLKDQTKSIGDYRPYCQRPDACGASGLKHCYSCAKLIAPESEVA
ncbi:DUF2312 domain-containing protein [Phyllobacterium brassicacearum]|uniref:DUF2312 domain-containing protein n=1 Tax=Phyllobacterium brassicacearum TaxID=314235 RepID=A0A2P7BQ43_9HYPH|nr:GapR family DNA-binding domain-containing protein [Phyllobacterium brassicacearum]PSH68569.1 DUF2312 domain-containing protein [Phyllobacterium brassicacearum]TDQ19922.1 uncharacterized protein (UPF0335 family) [Phyllobacterium brassicacearum]